MSIGNNTYLDKNGKTVSTPGSLGYVTVLDFNPAYSLPGENFNSTRTTDWSSIPDFSAAHNLTFVIENPATHTLLGNISYNQDLNLLTSGIDSGLAVLGNNLAISSTGNSTNFTMTSTALNSVFNYPATLTMYPNNFPFAGYENITITATTDSGTTTTLFDKGVWLSRAGSVSPTGDVTVVGNSLITLSVLHFSKYDFFETAPVANFTGTPASGNAPLTVQFTDTSIYSNPTSWNWSFGDGNFSVAENPVYTYVSAGSYPVSLTAADGGGSNTTTRANYINVSAALPIPVFTGTPTSGHAPLSVQFNDTTQGTGIQYWNWSFGDTSWFNTTDVTAKNVTHLYSSAGSFTVNLSVTNSSGLSPPATITNTTSFLNYISVTGPLPVPGFTGSPRTGNATLVVQFNDTTLSPGITAWNWSFGDGAWSNTTTALLRNATHPYPEGMYTVNLSVTNSSGTNTISQAGYIVVGPPRPIPDFTGSPTSGNPPLAVQFNDTTLSPGITSWNWSFGDNSAWFNTTDATQRNAAHTYSATGTFTVNLTVTNTTGVNTTSRSGYISTLPSPPSPSFTGSPVSGLVPLFVQFTDTSTSPGITVWNWSFGDGSWFNTTDATQRNANYTYVNAGSYTVGLSVTNTSGTNTTTRNDFITATGSAFPRRHRPRGLVPRRL